MISDYEKLFRKDGYYDHCRARYDLVLREKEKMKAFLNVSDQEKITTHFLFVSSKPLEIEFQDNDGIVYPSPSGKYVILYSPNVIL